MLCLALKSIDNQILVIMKIKPLIEYSVNVAAGPAELVGQVRPGPQGTISVGIEEIMLENIKYSSTHIFGELENEEILINRVSGEITSSIGNTRPQLGMCELLDSRKF